MKQFPNASSAAQIKSKTDAYEYVITNFGRKGRYYKVIMDRLTQDSPQLVSVLRKITNKNYESYEKRLNKLLSLINYQIVRYDSPAGEIAELKCINQCKEYTNDSSGKSVDDDHTKFDVSLINLILSIQASTMLSIQFIPRSTYCEESLFTLLLMLIVLLPIITFLFSVSTPILFLIYDLFGAGHLQAISY